MGIMAFTNEVGVHLKREPRFEYQRGKYYDNDDVNELISAFDVSVEESRKPTATQSDHHRPTDYGRTVNRVTIDEPAKKRRYVENDHQVIIDLEEDYYISQDIVIGTAIDPDPGYQNAFDRSVATALNRINSADAGVGADLGQTRKTIDEFAELSHKFAQALLAMKRGNIKAAYNALLGLTGHRANKSALKGLSDLWLAYIYGIKPLMSDLYQLGEAVGHRLSKPPQLKATASDFSNWTNVGSGANYNWKQSANNSFRTELFAIVVNPNLRLATEAGLTNPVDIAWELLPWSFVVDWFIPVGNVLTACTAGCGLQSNGGWTTVQHYAEIDMFHNITFTGYGYGFTEPGHYREINYQFVRVCYTDFPMPHFYANVHPYSTVRALNALALVSQLT